MGSDAILIHILEVVIVSDPIYCRKRPAGIWNAGNRMNLLLVPTDEISVARTGEQSEQVGAFK